MTLDTVKTGNVLLTCFPYVLFSTYLGFRSNNASNSFRTNGESARCCAADWFSAFERKLYVETVKSFVFLDENLISVVCVLSTPERTNLTPLSSC